MLYCTAIVPRGYGTVMYCIAHGFNSYKPYIIIISNTYEHNMYSTILLLLYITSRPQWLISWCPTSSTLRCAACDGSVHSSLPGCCACSSNGVSHQHIPTVHESNCVVVFWMMMLVTHCDSSCQTLHPFPLSAASSRASHRN